MFDQFQQFIYSFKIATLTPSAVAISCHNSCVPNRCLLSTPFENSCMECLNADRVIYKNQCMCDIGNGKMVSKPNSQNCLNCHSSCATCPLSVTDQCTTCIDKTYYTTNPGAELCHQCPVPCYECEIGAGIVIQCVSCIPGFLYDSINQSCSCPAGYFQKGSTCELCSTSCMTCVGTADDCTTCSQNSSLNPQTQKCVCNSGFEENLISQQCIAIKCKDNSHLAVVNNKCVCDDGFQQDADGICRKNPIDVNSSATTSSLPTSSSSSSATTLQNGKLTKIRTPAEQERADNFQQSGTIVAAATSISVIPILMMSPGIALQLFDVFEMIRYILLIDIEYPLIVYDFLEIFKEFSLDFIPKFVPEVEGEMRSPHAFTQQGYNSLFFINIQQYAIALASFFGTYLVFKIFQFFLRNQEIQTSRSKRVINHIIGDLEWGGFLGGIEGCYLAFSCFSMLQIQNSSVLSDLQALSYVFSILGFLGVMFFPFVIIILSHVVKKYSKDPVFVQKWGFLSKMFGKEDLLSSGFFAILTLRKFIMTIGLVFLHDYPMLNIFICALLAASVGCYVFLRKPYEDKVANQRDIVSEFSFFIIHMISFLYLYTDKLSHTQAENTGIIIIALIVLIAFMHLRLVFKQNYVYLKEMYQKFCKHTVEEENDENDHAKTTQLHSIGQKTGESDSHDSVHQLTNVSKSEISQTAGNTELDSNYSMLMSSPHIETKGPDSNISSRQQSNNTLRVIDTSPTKTNILDQDVQGDDNDPYKLQNHYPTFR